MPKGFGRGGGGRGGRGHCRRRSDRTFGIGRSQNCICPSCGMIVPHRTGFPCFQINCPQCNTPMTRQLISPDFSDSTGRISSNLIPKIDSALCTGCGKCVEACPVDAITIVNKKAIINEYRCNACRACISACPADAIK